MRTRLLFAIVLMGGLSSALARSALAQAAPAPVVGGAPVIIDNSNLGLTDPYATVGVQPQPWFGGLPIFQATPESLANRSWFRIEYLRWRTRGMRLPALVTTSPPGTPLPDAGVLGEPGTAVLFGLGRLNDGSVSGIRTRSGFWFRNGTAGFHSEFFQFRDEKDGFATGSDGTSILGRPFFDISDAEESARLISFPDLVAGNIFIGSRTRLKSYMFTGRFSMCPIQGMGCGGEEFDRVDWIVGYRHIYLRDQLSINENLTSLVVAEPGTVATAEFFQARNKFHGLQLGTIYQANFRRAWLETLLRVAIGNNRQQVTVSGVSTITNPAGSDGFVGALLAQRTNIGNYDRKQFTMIPEVGLTFGFRVTRRLHATVGYTVLYFPSVVRASEQIDTDVNETLLPPEIPPATGALRPRFRFVENDYWAHGLNVGAEFRF